MLCRDMTGGSSLGNAPVEPIGVVRRLIMRVVSSAIEGSRGVAAELRRGQGARRYDRRRRLDARIRDRPKAVDSVAMPDEEHPVRIVPLVRPRITPRPDEAETDEQIGTVARARLGV